MRRRRETTDGKKGHAAPQLEHGEESVAEQVWQAPRLGAADCWEGEEEEEEEDATLDDAVGSGADARQLLWFGSSSDRDRAEPLSAIRVPLPGCWGGSRMLLPLWFDSCDGY